MRAAGGAMAIACAPSATSAPGACWPWWWRWPMPTAVAAAGVSAALALSSCWPALPGQAAAQRLFGMRWLRTQRRSVLALACVAAGLQRVHRGSSASPLFGAFPRRHCHAAGCGLRQPLRGAPERFQAVGLLRCSSP